MLSVACANCHSSSPTIPLNKSMAIISKHHERVITPGEWIKSYKNKGKTAIFASRQKRCGFNSSPRHLANERGVAACYFLDPRQRWPPAAPPYRFRQAKAFAHQTP